MVVAVVRLALPLPDGGRVHLHDLGGLERGKAEAFPLKAQSIAYGRGFRPRIVAEEFENSWPVGESNGVGFCLPIVYGFLSDADRHRNLALEEV